MPTHLVGVDMICSEGVHALLCTHQRLPAYDVEGHLNLGAIAQRVVAGDNVHTVHANKQSEEVWQ